MKHLSKLILSIILVFTLTHQFVSALDKQFILDYSKKAGIPVDHIRICEESDLFEDEYFDDEFGLCIVTNYLFTDSDLGGY